jgi:hypothetical protein
LQRLLALLGLVMADSAACGCSQHAMMAGEVSGDAADDGPFDAAPGLGGDGCKSNRESERRAAQNRLHVGRSVYFLFANSSPASLFRLRAIRNSVREVRIATVWAPIVLPADTQPNRSPTDSGARHVAMTDKTGITPSTSDVMDY